MGRRTRYSDSLCWALKKVRKDVRFDKRKGRRLTLDYSDTDGLRAVDYSGERGFNGKMEAGIKTSRRNKTVAKKKERPVAKQGAPR